MKILFQTKANKVELVDKERLIFNIDGKFVNESGEVVQVEEKFYKREELDEYKEDDWYKPWMEYEGLEEPLKSEIIVESVCDIDNVFGQYEFKNKAGEFVIEPQYADAREFTNGLSAVNLRRTWLSYRRGQKIL